MKPLTDALEPRVRKPRFSIDRVLLVLMSGVAVLGIMDFQQLPNSLAFTLKAMTQIAPFFLIAVVFAAWAKASGADQLIARAFSGNVAVGVVAASLAGALSPFCSCGVIPLMAAMLASGVPLAPVMAFCVSSPIMDPEMFLLTAAGVSLPFAAAKTATAVGMGLFAGGAVAGLKQLGFLGQPLREASGCGCSRPSNAPGRTASIRWQFWKEAERRGLFSGEAKKNGFFLGKWMVLAFFIESLMVAYIPSQWVAGLVGSGSSAAIPLAAVVGVPAYMNGFAAIPLISGLMAMGMTPGAALSFATAGAVSSIPAALAVYALVRRPVFLLYLAIGLSGSVVAGYLYQWSGAY
ncbi:MAG: permease [Desulfobacterales bacterium]|jgi:uncharacterized membrane protein YraQ (UPF0718 family)